MKLALAFGLALAGGATTTPPAWAAEVAEFVPVDQAGWRDARAEVSRLRNSVPAGPRVENVRVGFRGPGGIGFQGRGAIAVSPGRALRMVLLGPAGRTALDVWATPDRYRLAVPELGIVERGGAEAPKHLPVALFREWFLAPLGGRLLAAGTVGGSRVYLVRGKTHTIELRAWRNPEGPADRTTFVVRKHDAAGDELVSWAAVGSAHRLLPAAGTRVVFQRPVMGIRLRSTSKRSAPRRRLPKRSTSLPRSPSRERGDHRVRRRFGLGGR